MPFILICGTPASGKTVRAEKIKAYLEQTHSKKVYLINEESLLLQKQDAYDNYAQEKITRAFLKSNVEKHLNQDDIVILDSLNYIKGFRYELFCLARTAKTAHCVIWCNTNDKACKEYFDLSSNKLTEAQFEDFTQRFEVPKLNNRWDTPLFELRYLEEEPLEKIADTLLFQQKKSKDPISTALDANISSNFMSELDKQVSSVNETILQVQNEQIQSNVTFGKMSVDITRSFSVIELKKFKIEFLKICKQNPPKNTASIQESYASYVHTASQRL